VCVGLGIRIGVGVFLNHPGGEIATQLAGPLFALLESNELWLMLGVEHQVKGCSGLREEALSELFAAWFGIGRRGRHDRDSTGTTMRVADGQRHPIPQQGRNNAIARVGITLVGGRLCQAAVDRLQKSVHWVCSLRYSARTWQTACAPGALQRIPEPFSR